MANEKVETGVQVGMGGTIRVGTDLYPCTVLSFEVFKSGPHAGRPRVVTVQGDRVPFYDTYGRGGAIWPDSEGPIDTFRANRKGTLLDRKTIVLTLGERESYQDPHF
jgi:hypothetical protein